MSQADITRLVVGDPITLALGRAVGQSLRSSDVSKSLQWRDGKWQGQKSLLSVLATKKPKKLIVLPAGTGRRIRLNAWVVAAFVGLAVTGVALGMLLQSRGVSVAGAQQAAAGQSLPLVQATENVRSVDQPFPQAPAENFQVIRTEQGQAPSAETPSLPIMAPPGVGNPSDTVRVAVGLPFVAPAPMPTPIGAVPESTSDRVTQRGESRGPAKPAKEEPKPPAVILDEMELDEKPKVVATAKPEPAVKVAREAAKPTLNSSATEKPAAPSLAPSAPALAPARGLIAITPDGKSAVFTDPATRLPKQFKVGDKLVNGDTIKSIDGAQGKVIAGTKEYSLD